MKHEGRKVLDHRSTGDRDMENVYSLTDVGKICTNKSRFISKIIYTGSYITPLAIIAVDYNNI